MDQEGKSDNKITTYWPLESNQMKKKNNRKTNKISVLSTINTKTRTEHILSVEKMQYVGMNENK